MSATMAEALAAAHQLDAGIAVSRRDVAANLRSAAPQATNLQPRFHSAGIRSESRSSPPPYPWQRDDPPPVAPERPGALSQLGEEHGARIRRCPIPT